MNACLPDYHTFMAYDTKTARWRPLRIPLPPDLVFTEYPSLKRIWKGRAFLADVLPPFLVECNNRLLLLGFREDRLASSIAGAGELLCILHIPSQVSQVITPVLAKYRVGIDEETVVVSTVAIANRCAFLLIPV
jgi:hypothetical protein